MKFNTRFLIYFTATTLLILSLQIGQVFAGQKKEVIAELGGQIIGWSEIEDKKINDLRKELYRLVIEKLKVYSIQKLSETDPAFQGKPNLSVPEKKLQEIYQVNNLAQRGTYEQFKPYLEEYYRKQLKGQFLDQLFAKAILSGKVKINVQNPQNFTVKVEVGDAMIRGNKEAQVMVLEFSDYQCPFCLRVQDTIEALRSQYGSQVVFGYKHLPLEFHKEAKNAANAVECAREQGKFESYHKYLFKHNNRLQLKALKEHARAVKVAKPKQFDRCLDSGKYLNRVQRNLAEAKKLSINGAPSFIIGKYDAKKKVVEGEIISGALPKEKFVQLINRYL